VVTVAALTACGGSYERSGDAPDESHDPGGGAGNDSDECSEVAGGAAGCGGEAGATPLEDFAKLRSACGLNATVNRGAGPGKLCFRIR
jgi:hypothetical protein